MHTRQYTTDTWANLGDWTCKCISTCLEILQVDGSYVEDLLYSKVENSY